MDNASEKCIEVTQDIARHGQPGRGISPHPDDSRPGRARLLFPPELRIRFTGGREMHSPADCARFIRALCLGQKKFGRTEVVSGASGEEAVVYMIGTLYGEWLDGTPFSGNRYVDRYVVSNGRITEMQVWNDSAEWLLVRAGLAEAWPSPMAHGHD